MTRHMTSTGCAGHNGLSRKEAGGAGQRVERERLEGEGSIGQYSLAEQEAGGQYSLATVHCCRRK